MIPRFLKKNYRHILLTVAVGSALVLGAPLALRLSSATLKPPPKNEMAVYVMSVGQGDSILAEEGDRQILIDGGPSSAILAKLGAVMPAGDRTIDLVVLTHPHADHITGLVAVLKKYKVGKILMTDANAGTKIQRSFLALIASKKIPADNPDAVKTETVGDMEYEVLSYGNESDVIKKHKGSNDGLNDSSIVGMLKFKDKRFLLMGDATEAVEDSALAAKIDLKADFLKIGHHGSAYSTGEDFLKAVSPAYAAMSLGYKNAYNFPASRVLALLKKFATPYFRTDLVGDITAVTDGASLQVSASKVK